MSKEQNVLANPIDVTANKISNPSISADEEKLDYLSIALAACEAYDEELGDQYFDEKPS